MEQSPTVPEDHPSAPDRLTLISISALSYMAAVGLHEHLGYTAACLLLGSHPFEVGAFHVNCDYAGMSELSTRWVSAAGPLVSLIFGTLSFLVLRWRPPRSITAYYSVGLLGSIGWMSATGYLLFSGISGMGDFGTGRDGLFYQVSPEWLWQALLILVGIIRYSLIVSLAIREIDHRIGGAGKARIRFARQLVLTSYLTGPLVSIVTGLLNPHGLMIVLFAIHL